VWRETPFFSDRERAALAWTEALTLLPQSQAPDAEYDVFSRYFNDREKVDLTLSIGLINVWNRLAVGFRKSPIA
jgi:alkylhydroperoxidase family enzyme